MPKSLYTLWKQTVAAHADAIALTDASTGHRQTFSQLDAAATAASQFPSGNTAEFILQTIAAWRAGLPICPLEPNSARPELENLRGEIAHVKMTSGSTGTPRLILFTAEQLAADAGNIVATMQLNPDRPNIGVISMAHSYGFSNLILPLLLHGIPLIIGGDPLPGSFSRALTFLPETGGTVPAVPAMWRAWMKAGCLDSAKIKTAISAGAPLTMALETDIFETTSIKVHNFYGSSECGGIAYDRTDTPRELPEAVGTAMAGVEASISRDGCLQVRGAAVGGAYWPKADDEALSGGKFVTSDLAEIASDGTITLRGRRGDLINIAGRKLDPSSIETELQQHPAVGHCLVFGVPSSDPERVQDIVAICNSGDEASLRSDLAKKLPAWQKVRHWWITPTLRPDARGKLSRASWKEKWLASSPGNENADG